MGGQRHEGQQIGGGTGVYQGAETHAQMCIRDSSMANLQTVSIIAAFPIGFIIVMIVWSFFKDARHYLDKENSETQNIR